ncbi:uncharacterized protein LOC118565940 [Fundulus heteroclitus]|uniref:uncharacterized protein LOC118565940 n=1 Tax=Fundulus heteroclitus TaxID=8078 RepID=UPI00165AA2D5|nr:uncharacterized protein LOC118565940 [Fundulus heteroclitus]
MSYPMYNPYASGNQCTSQDQYGLASGQMEGTICRTITNPVPGSSLSLPGAPSTNPAGLGRRVVQQLTGGSSLPVRNGPGQSQTTLDFNMQTTFNICARENIRYQPTGQGALFTSMQRDIYSLSTTAESNYSASSASQDPQQSRVVGGSGSFNWLPGCSESSLNIHDYAAQSTDHLLPHEPVCTPQLAERILMSYGLQKEDLYELINYPDEETTAENLPYTLQKIWMKNANRAITQDAIPQPAVGGNDRLVSFGQPTLFHNEMPSINHRTVEMAQYGQIRICTPNTQDETFENLLSKAQTTSMSSGRNVVAAVQQVQTQSSQTVQPIIPALSSQNNNTDITTPKFGLFGVPPGETPITHFTSKTQSRSVITQGVNFGEPILVHTESADANCAKAQSKTQERASKIAEETSQQAPQTWMQKPSLLQLTQAVQPEEPTALKPVTPPPPVIRTVTDVSHPIPHSGINTVSPTVPSLALVETTAVQGRKRQSPVKPATFKGLPSLGEMQDYAATKPTRFSHTCSLCKKTCAQMKDWIDHQQTSLHLLNCKRLRRQYPDWDGKVTPRQSDTITSKIIPSTSYHTSQGHQKKTSDGSHSRSLSHSPRRCCTSRNRKGSSSSSSRSQSPHRRRSSRRRRSSTSSTSRSRSPYRRCGSRPRWATTSSSSRSHSSHRRCGSRHRRGTSSSSSRSHSPHRRGGSRRRRGTSSSSSCSRSPHRRGGSRRRRGTSSSSSRSRSRCRSSEDRRRKLRKRTQSLHSPRESRRSPSSLFSTRYNHSIVSRYSRRASYSEVPKGRYNKLGSPRRSSKLRSPPRTNDVRSGSPRRDLKPRLSPRKCREQKFPPVTSRERQILQSRDEKQRSRKSPNRQLSPRSVEKEKSRGRSRERRRSPRKSIEQQQVLPRRAGNKQTPVRTDERKSSPILDDKRHSPCSGNRDKLPSPKRNDGEQPTKKWDELSKVSGSRKRQLSLEESSSQQKRSCSEQTLTGHLNSGFSVPEQPLSASVFEPLISVVLAEQAKRQASSSPHSSFASLTKTREASESEGTSPASALSSTSCMPEKCDQFAHLSKPSPPTMLRLKGNFDTLSHGDMIAAMESFGKIKSLLLFKSKQEATVCFEKEEDATRLRSKKNLEIKGVSLTFVTKQESASEARPPTSAEDQKNPSPEKPAVSHQSISGRNLVLLPIKALLSLQRTSKKSTAVKLVKKAIVLVSKGKSVSKKLQGLNGKAVSLAAKQSVKSAKGKKEASKPKKTPIPGQKSCRKSKVDVKDPVTVAEKNQGKEDLPKPETTSKLRLKEDNESESVGKAMKPSEAKALQSESSENRPQSRRKVEESAAKSLNTAPASAAQTVEAEISTENVQEFVASPENPVKVLETIGVTATEANERTHAKEVGTEMKNVTGADLSELENTGVSEPLKVDPLTEKDQKPAVEKSSPPKLKDAGPPVSEVGTAVNANQMTAQCPDTSVRALTQVQMSGMSNPEPTALNLKTSVKPLQTEAQAAGSSAGSPVETVPAVVMKTDQKDTVVTAKTQTSPVLNPPAVSPAAAQTSVTVKTTAALGKKQPAVPACPAFDTSLTAGEKLVPECLDRLILNTKACVKAESILLGGPFSVDSTLLLITDLPMYNSCSYTEKEVVNLLCKFGFQYAHDNIYILPQGCMAFVLMPNERSVMDLIRASTHNHLVLKQHKLCLHIVKKDILMTPLGFYKSIMELASFKVEGTNSIYIKDISPSDTIDVREALRKIGSVRNFLPLLNKVFVEFDSVYDADRLAIWCSLMKVGFAYSVERLRIPRSCRKAQPPKQPLNAQPDCDEIIAGAEIPNAKYGIPQGTAPPFWVTMTTIPYVFPTVCPWFNIPDFLTIRGKKDLSIQPHPGSAYCTVMLTGLPEGNYKHKDVAKLVWRYFPKQNLQTLYYNILVLPLQRRAFVFFCDREACCSFVLDHVKKPVCVRSCNLTVHFVLQDIRPGPSEEIMYRAMMKWSNAHVPGLDFLEKRLLCVEIPILNVDLIKSIMKEIAFIASFVNYLPLANRICIEMLEAGGVKQVLDKIASMENLSTHSTWSKVGRVECLKGLRKRLEESEQITLDLEASSTGGGGKPSLMQTATSLLPAQTSRDVALSETAKAASSAESTASKPEEEGAPTVCKPETKPVERFAAPAEVHKPVGGATDLSGKGQDARVSAEAPNASKCEAKPAEAGDPPEDFKPGDRAEKKPDHGASAGPADVSASKEETGGKAVRPHSLTAQVKSSEEESAPHTPPESAALSEKKAEETSSLSAPSRPETARAHQPCKNDSAAAGEGLQNAENVLRHTFLLTF